MALPSQSAPLLGPPSLSALAAQRMAELHCRSLVVRRYLRWVQLGLYLCTSIFGLLVCVTVTVTWKDLEEKCPLYAEPGPDLSLREHNASFLILQTDSVLYGDLKTCYYCIYVNLTASTYALVWGLIYGLITASTRLRRNHFHRLIFPSLLFNAVLFTCELIASCVLTLGYNHWCRRLVELVQKTTVGLKMKTNLTCGVIQRIPWPTSNQHLMYVRGARMFSLLTFAQFSSWILTLCTFALSMICAERFFKFIWLGEIDLAEFEAAVALEVGMGGKLPRKLNGGPRSAGESHPNLPTGHASGRHSPFSQLFRSSPEASLSGGHSGQLSLGSGSPTLRFRIQANPNALDVSDSEHASDSEDKEKSEGEEEDEEGGEEEEDGEQKGEEEEKDESDDDRQFRRIRDDLRAAAANGVPRGKRRALIGPRFPDGSILVTWSPPDSPQLPRLPLRPRHPLAEDHELQERLLELSPARKPTKDAKRSDGRRKKRFRLLRGRRQPEDLELVSSV